MSDTRDSVERLAEIRTRLEAATPGPWQIDWATGHIVSRPFTDDVSFVIDTEHPGIDKPEPDFVFIAHALDDIAFLLDHISALRSSHAGMLSDMATVLAERDALAVVVEEVRRVARVADDLLMRDVCQTGDCAHQYCDVRRAAHRALVALADSAEKEGE